MKTRGNRLGRKPWDWNHWHRRYRRKHNKWETSTENLGELY